MGSASKDLLQLEDNIFFPPLPLESLLRVCDKNDSSFQTMKPHPDTKPITCPVPHRQVMGKVKDFLGVLSESNKRLEEDAKDLMLGVADLRTPGAVGAAESAIAGTQPSIPLDGGSSESESEDLIEVESDGEKNNRDRGSVADANNSSSKTFKSTKDRSGSKKNPKIVEMS